MGSPFRVGRFLVSCPVEELAGGAAAVALLQELAPFYTDDVIGRILMPLQQGRSSFSMRTFHWLVSNYAKKRRIILLGAASRSSRCASFAPTGTKGSSGGINIYESYRQMVLQFGVRLFDVFQRGVRI